MDLTSGRPGPSVQEVLAADINPEKAAETAAMIVAEGGHAIACNADVSQPSDVSAIVEQAVQYFGGWIMPLIMPALAAAGRALMILTRKFMTACWLLMPKAHG